MSLEIMHASQSNMANEINGTRLPTYRHGDLAA